jgi:hypothetical protein
VLYDTASFIIVVTGNRCSKERVSENREVSHFRPVVAESRNFVDPDWDLDTKKGSFLWLFLVFIIIDETDMLNNCKKLMPLPSTSLPIHHLFSPITNLMVYNQCH